MSDHWYASSPGYACSEHGALNHGHILGTVMLLHNLIYRVAENLRGFNRFLKFHCVLHHIKKI